jgi:hypothetical protein
MKTFKISNNQPTFFMAQQAQAQVVANVNVGTPPVWDLQDILM